LGTPSLLPLSNGTLLASHDYFGWGQVLLCRNKSALSTSNLCEAAVVTSSSAGNGDSRLACD